MKTVNTVLETSDWSLFNYLKENRVVVRKSNLVNSIKKYGQLQPIMVDEKFNIIDGQHRLDACVFLNIPVKYIVDKGANRAMISDINSTQKSWTKDDYINHWAQRGHGSFIKLKELMTGYGLPSSTIIILLDNHAVKVTYSSVKQIREGTFEITPEALARFEFRLEKIIDLWAVSDRTFEHKFKNSRMMYALVRLISHPAYDHQYFLQKLTGNIVASQVKVPANTSDCCAMLAEIYNRNRKQGRVDLSADIQTWERSYPEAPALQAMDN